MAGTRSRRAVRRDRPVNHVPPDVPGYQAGGLPAHWQPSFGPPQSGPPQFGPSQFGPPPPRRHGRAAAKVVVLLVVIALLSTAGFVVNRLLVSAVGGATSATASVQRFFDALEGKDWTALGLLLPPDETSQVAGLLRDTADLQESIGGSADSVTDQLDGVSIDVSDLSLSSEEVARDLTKVVVERATIVVEIDEKATESLTDLIPDAGIDGLGSIGVTVSINGAEVSYDYRGGSDSDSGSESLVIGGDTTPPFLMSVRRDGGWFVSPMFTVAQYVAEESGWETEDSDESHVTFDSPDEAAAGFVEGLAETIATADIGHVADAMGGVEARLLRTYAAGINAELESDPDLGLGPDVQITVRDTDFDVTPGEDGQARIKISHIGLEFGSDGRRATIDFDGDCVRFVADDEPDEGGCISDGGEFASRLYRSLGHLVAIPQDGGWKVSPVATYVDWLGIAVRELAGVDADLLAAVVDMDFSRLAAREPAGRIGVSDEITVEIAPVSTSIYAGVSVLEAEPSADLVEYSCTSDNAPYFCEIIVVDREGRRIEQESTYDVGTGYRRGYAVTGETRLLVAGVAGAVVVESAPG
ncbi:proline-rich domain-containing protein [Gordonia rubripertincta]|uniref:Proline-rich domain-containing protein n=1 Tax=Gordonia rubripertincta TaxID=36822 RepID=A0ABT4N1V2_GORRU|nr:proline-rich domain-containing protein [Gordonia rubripertincta]MCZ4552940.1 proline-rich domain-containing protein [Gordonia rubripertincta]